MVDDRPLEPEGQARRAEPQVEHVPEEVEGDFSAAALSARARKVRLWMSSWFRWASERKIARWGRSGTLFP